MKVWIFPLVLFLSGGCAHLHHVQLGDIDSTSGPGEPFEVKVSETGVDLHDIKTAQQIFLKDNKAAERFGNAAALVGLIQMGPRTGNPVYVEKYAEGILKAVERQCPSGRITGLTSIRETRKYPVISGEIVKVKGLCVGSRSAAKKTPVAPTKTAAQSPGAKRRPAQSGPGFEEEESEGDEGDDQTDDQADGDDPDDGSEDSDSSEEGE